MTVRVLMTTYRMESKLEKMVAAHGWRKSTRCEAAACVEVSTGGTLVGLRNSTVPEVSLALDPTTWRQFIAGVRAGEFDRDA